MPENGFGGTSGAAIVEEEVMLVDNGNEAKAPERRGAPFLAGGFEIRAVVGQAFAHVMEQEIGEGMKGLVCQFGKMFDGLGLQRRHVAGGAAHGAEQFFALLD